ncbi:MAG TPA: tripartite tricarboxylate transporter substrate binding protein [Burkholderiales bacterium]|nr:tripartite tricarboxylate transporter substrate binding protein [Burkholderiales bacterium]
MHLARRIVRLSLACVVAGLVSVSAAYAAEKYPARPVRFIIPFPPGGGNDILGRAFAERMGERMGQQWVVDNRGGASTIIAAEIVARAPADGYTLLLGTNTTLSVIPSLRDKLPYDPLKDYDMISLMSSSPYLLVVHPSFEAKSVKELIALAKAKPRQINYASPGHGTSNHLSFELFMSMAGIKLTHIPYKGTGPALAELLGGQVPLMLASTASVRPLVLSGKLRALGISTAKRSPAMPEVPPIAESGVPGYSNASWVGLISPRGTPPAIVKRLNAEINKVIDEGDLKDKLGSQGFVPDGSTPQEFAAHVKDELTRFRKLVKEAGIKPE